VYLHHVNVLLEGPQTAIKPVVRGLTPHLRQPVVSIRSAAGLSLPTVDIGTLILEEVHTLTMQGQTQLLDWLNAASSRPQVISTSWQPLFPCVELGLFADALYYRLNVILMRLQGHGLGIFARMGGQLSGGDDDARHANSEKQPRPLDL
jgi:hypothetical protein